jgi:hypothetical protein
MKNIISLLLFTLTFISCQKSKNDKIKDVIEECNSVEFYRISEEKKHIVGNDTINDTKIVQGILSDNEKLNFNDQKIIDVLNKEYTKYSMNEDSSEDILDEFTEWNMFKFKIFYEACIPTYRDILLFKKDGKIVGFAKVCFDCSQSYIVVNKEDVVNLQLDYEDLKEILDELASS